MQAISVDLAQKDGGRHDIPLQLTRCYCTAVMMTHLLVNQVEEALQRCNHTSTKNRSMSDTRHSLSMAMSMRDDAMNEDQSSKHFMYYVLLTSYTSPTDNAREQHYFPGHVFVIEKVPEENTSPPFRLYQSYIGAYDLKKYMDMTRPDLHVTKERMKEILDGLVMMMDKGKVWGEDVCEFWEKLTLTNDFTEVNGMKIDGNIYFCYHKIDINNCNDNMQAFLRRHLTEIEKLKNNGKGGNVYGTHKSKNNEYSPLTVEDMHKELLDIIEKHPLK
jgi:hypothetical protein